MWIKIALQEASPVLLVAVRVLLGALFGIAVILFKHVKMPKGFKEWKPFLVLGATNLAIPFFLISWGQQYIDSSVAAILDATVPLFTIFMAHYLLSDDKMTVPKAAGLATGFIGVVVLLSKGIGSSTNNILGQAAVVLASMFYAGSGIYIRKTTKDTPAILRSTGPLMAASAIMWITVFATGQQVHIPSAGLTWIALFFLGVVGSGVAFVICFYLIHEIGPTRTSMVTYIFPLGGVILGVIFLHEHITWQLITGGSLIVASLVVANTGKSGISYLRKLPGRLSMDHPGAGKK